MYWNDNRKGSSNLKVKVRYTVHTFQSAPYDLHPKFAILVNDSRYSARKTKDVLRIRKTSLVFREYSHFLPQKIGPVGSDRYV